MNTVALSCLPAIWNKLFDTKASLHTFRPLVHQLAPVIVDKLGDNKVKVSDLAIHLVHTMYSTLLKMQQAHPRETLPLLNMLDKELKNNGFGHKVNKGRENVLVY